MPRLLVVIFEFLFVMLGSAGYAYLVYVLWCTGYRVENWAAYESKGMALWMLMLLWIALMVWLISFKALTIYQEPKHRKSRIVMLIIGIVTLTAVLMAYLSGLGSDAIDQGRKAMQSEISLDQLATDCLTLSKLKLENGQTWHIGEEVAPVIVFSPTIQRLRPASICTHSERVILEFHGGFDHYGYQLIKDADAKQWNLEWYTESSSERLLSVEGKKYGSPCCRGTRVE